MSNDQLAHDFAAAGEEAARRIRAQREAKERPKRTTAENGDAFAQHLQAQLDQQAENTPNII